MWNLGSKSEKTAAINDIGISLMQSGAAAKSLPDTQSPEGILIFSSGTTLRETAILWIKQQKKSSILQGRLGRWRILGI